MFERELEGATGLGYHITSTGTRCQGIPIVEIDAVVLSFAIEVSVQED